MFLKKLFAAAALAAALPFALAPGFAPALAAETADGYARVLREDVYLYAEPQEESGLFILPRTYFVKITGEAGDYYRVEYLTGTDAAPVRGYCRTGDVEPVDYIPEAPFLLYETEVTFTAGDAGLPADFITEYTVPAAFYGTFYYGSSVYYYVCLDGKFGYVPANSCPPLDYPENTEHTAQETPDPPREGAGNANAVNIVLICALSVAALGAVYFLFRPAKPASARPAPFDDYEQPD